MRKPSPKVVIIAELLCALIVARQASAATIVVPNSAATEDASAFVDGGAGPVRFMQIYDASQFAALSQPFLITEIAFRPDATPGPTGPRTVTMQLFASTTSRSVAELSSTFAENIGPDNALLFEGTQIWSTASLPGPGNTKQFDILQPLTTPFLYDPQAGNLVLDFQLSSNSGPLIRRDAAFPHPAINIVVGPGAATTGNVLGFGYVTQFTVEPVPEPSAAVLAGIGAMVAMYCVWQRRKRARNGSSRGA
jgi:hypothetical protein